MIDASHLPLATERFHLRVLATADAWAFAEGAADPLVRRYGHLPEPSYTEASVRAMITDVVAPALDRGELAVLAVSRPTGDFCGSLVLFDVTAESAELGFWIHPRHRGQGAVTDALVLAAQLARRSGLRTLRARTAIDNAAAQHTLTRAEYREVDRGDGVTPAGETIGLISYRRDLVTE